VKIVFTGPECSGKTTLAELVSHKYNFQYVAEKAREYLDSNMNMYNEDSLMEIARLQMDAEKVAEQNGEYLCCDTDLLTIIIWQNEKFGYYDQSIMDSWNTSFVDAYFLCSPDFPWVYDPQRENPFDRDRLFNIYAYFLSQSTHPFYILDGPLDTRISTVDKILRDSVF